MGAREEGDRGRRPATHGELASPFLEEELFAEESDAEWEAHLSALEAESPFRQAFEHGATSPSESEPEFIDEAGQIGEEEADYLPGEAEAGEEDTTAQLQYEAHLQGEDAYVNLEGGSAALSDGEVHYGMAEEKGSLGDASFLEDESVAPAEHWSQPDNGGFLPSEDELFPDEEFLIELADGVESHEDRSLAPDATNLLDVPFSPSMGGANSHGREAAEQEALPTDAATTAFTEESPRAAAPPSANLLRWDGASNEQIRFMRRVYNRQVSQSAARPGARFVASVPSAELEVVEHGQTLHRAAAQRCREMLAEARATLGREQAAGNSKAREVKDFGARSGYRSVERQFAGWQSAFRSKYYPDTRKQREGLPGGAHGEAAVTFLVNYVRKRIGAPGYSLHNSGLAMDFFTNEGSLRLGPDTSAKNVAAWKTTWFFGWLSSHANAYRFFQNIAIDEPWHWEYRPTGEKVPTRAPTSASTSVSPAATPATLDQRPLRPTADLVRFTQRVLNAAEGEKLKVDADLGPLTRGALERFRRKHGLGTGGVLDEKTEIALVQRALEELAQQSLFPIGVRDAATDQAVARFKAERGLGSGASLDDATRLALADALDQRRGPAGQP
jgi:LAS superfamily LD-carboxypeptidase LdcB